MLIDLNCDLGESFGQYQMGLDEAIIKVVSSVNIACGFHAGDYNVMAKTVDVAIANGVKIGAHPGFQDLQGFGRREIMMSNEDVRNMLLYQIGALDAFVRVRGGKLHHVKPHGALYNMAAKNYELSCTIVKAIKDYDSSLVLYGLSGSEMIKAAKELGLAVVSEVFADRGYTSKGTLVPRNREGAFIHDPKEAGLRIGSMVEDGTVKAVDGQLVEICAETVCVHGDNAEALEFVKQLNQVLSERGFLIG